MTPAVREMSVTKLMKAMGSKTGFDPIPPDQHAWQTREGQPPLNRMWGWMCAHTIHWGHRSPYAISKDGDALHIENAAEDLGMDLPNAYRTWREGVQLGLWRNGAKPEGKRNLYLCGEVVPPPASAPDPEGEIVCTDNLPPYILKEIKDWPVEKRRNFLAEHALHVRVQNTTLAELMAAGRLILKQVEDTRFERWGLAINRQEHTPKLPPEELAARQARLPAILPVVERYVQTVLTFVQASAEPLHNGSYNVSTDTASLLREPAREKPDGPPSSSVLTPSCGEPVDQDLDGKKPVNQLPIPTKPDRAKAVVQTSQKPAQAKPDPDEALQLAKALEVDLHAAAQMIAGARGADAKISLREIVGLAHAKLDQWRHQIRAGKIDNVPGRLIHSMPAAAVGGLRERVKEKVRRDIEKGIEYARLVIADDMASPEDKEREKDNLACFLEELDALGDRPRDRENAATAEDLKAQLGKVAKSKGMTS